MSISRWNSRAIKSVCNRIMPKRLAASTFTMIAALFVCTSPVSADGADEISQPGQLPELSRERESAASFDRRLPPVIPGEQIRDGNRSMSVISTAGEVAPYDKSVRAPQADMPANLAGVGGVIVDQRLGRTAPDSGHAHSKRNSGDPRSYRRDIDSGSHREDARGGFGSRSEKHLEDNLDWNRSSQEGREMAPPLIREPKLESQYPSESDAILGDVAPGKELPEVEHGEKRE